eukprot:Rmarinus@m.22041
MSFLRPFQYLHKGRVFSTKAIPKMAPYEFAEHLNDLGKRRAFAVYDRSSGSVVVSDPRLSSMKAFLENDDVDYLGHEGIFLEVGKRSGSLLGAFLWKTVRGQGCGGIRLWPYETMENYLRDGMRLAIGMGRKSALAGLWWGGGKGVIARPPGSDFRSREFRDLIFRDYGDFLSSLQGCYVAAEDAGVCVDDVDVVFSRTRYTTCISPALGGSGNPSIQTARGVVSSMEGALEFIGAGSLEGKTVAMQGSFEYASVSGDGCYVGHWENAFYEELRTAAGQGIGDRYCCHDRVLFKGLVLATNSLFGD